MSHQHGFVRLSAATPEVVVADPAANVDTMLSMLRGLPESDVVLFPELSISSYSCGRLFHQRALLEACEAQLKRMCEQAPNPKQVVQLRCRDSKRKGFGHRAQTVSTQL